jgi:hypothetical protein
MFAAELCCSPICEAMGGNVMWSVNLCVNTRNKAISGCRTDKLILGSSVMRILTVRTGERYDD